MKKLSIIIPMYNAEKFIDWTINAVENSNLPNDFYDIIVVDDGSVDNGMVVVKRLCEKYDNIRVYCQTNGGPGKARNTGIDKADAEYIWFIDADDKVEQNLTIIPTMIEEMPAVDIFSYTYNWIKGNKRKIGVGQLQPTVIHNKVISGRRAVLEGYQPGSVCGMIIKRSFLNTNNLRFKTDITQEDSEFTYRMMAVASKVFFSEETIYNYLIRSVSRNTPENPKKQREFQCDKVEIVNSAMCLAETFKETDRELGAYIHQYGLNVLFGCVYGLFIHRKEWGKIGVVSAVLQKLKENGYYPLKGDMGNLKKNIFKHILNVELLYK